MSRVTIRVPEELAYPLFFPNGEISWEKEDENTLNVSQPFIYEGAYFTGVRSLMPWDDKDISIPRLFEEWDRLKEPLRTHFSNRNKRETALLMKLGTAYFLELLYWANNRPVVLFPHIIYNELQIKPVNIKDRLEFIISRQNTYHSYMQLNELYREMEKAYAKIKVIHKE